MAHLGCHRPCEFSLSAQPGFFRVRGLLVLPPPFLPAPDEARGALTAVESIHHVSKSIRP